MKVLVVYYSLFGNTYQMAKAIVEGAKRVAGCEVLLRRVAELMPQETIDKNERMKQAQQAQRDVPIATMDDLAEADGYVFGSPTRFGNMCSQMKNFVDQTGQIWSQGKTIGKPAGVFACTASLHGGQESTLLTMMVPLFHLGMIMVGIPYSVQELFSTTRGGTPYGATAVVGPSADQPPTKVDLTIARALGERVAQVTKKLRS